jgi:hypothetical protein
MTDDNPNEQREVLAKKGNVLKSGRGLQIWGSQEGGASDEPRADPAGGHGNASVGTAERQARGGYMAGEPEGAPREAAADDEEADDAET